MGSLRLKRGDSTDRLNYTPLEGELILDTDTQQLFIGDGVTAGGNAVVAGNANVTITSNYSNSNVAAFLPTYTGNITANVITANTITGLTLSNVPAGNLTGTIPSVVLGNSTTYVGTTAIALNRSSAVQDLTGVTSIQNGNSNVSITANGNITVNAVGGVRLTAFSTGVNVAGTFSVSGNATVNGLTSNTTAAVTGNLTAGNLITAGQVVATGNVNGDHFVGTAINLTGNISATTFVSTATTGTAPLSVLSTTEVGNLNVKNANTVTNPAQGNITSVGTLTSLAVTGNASVGVNLAVTGNISGNVFTGNGSGLSAIAGANVTGTVANATYALDAGNANVANYVTLTATDTAASTHYLTFANSATANSQMRTDTDLNYNPSTNTLTVANISGTASQASNIRIYEQDSSVDDFQNPVLFAYHQSGNGFATAGMAYNMYYRYDTDRLYVGAGAGTGGFAGNLLGDVNGTANLANTSYEIFTNANASNTNFKMPFLNSTERAILFDSSGFTYNPSSNTLVVGNISATTAVASAAGNFTTSQITTLTVTGNTATANVTVGASNSSEGTRLLKVFGNVDVSANGNAAYGGLSARTITTTGNITTSAGLFSSPISTKTGTSTGTAGQVAWDDSYIYVCTATNVWKRVALTAF